MLNRFYMAFRSGEHAGKFEIVISVADKKDNVYLHNGKLRYIAAKPTQSSIWR